MPEPNERDIIEAHTVRNSHRRLFGDGDPEFASEECIALPAEHRYVICLRRAGVGSGQDGAGVMQPPRYGAGENNPIDREGW